MPDQFGRPTPEELMMQLRGASMQTGGNRFTPASGMEAGMQRPTLSPEQLEAMSRSFSGEEGKIASQRAMAQQMRGKGMPQGREVGPLGVYQAPNWGESLEGVANILGGAWLGRQANKVDTALDADRAEQQRMKLQYADDQEAYKDQYRQGRDKVTDALAQEELGLSKATLAAKTRANELAAGGTWKPKPVHLPEQLGGGTGTLVYNETLGQWREGDKTGSVVPPEVAKRILEYTAATTTGSRPASLLKQDEERSQAVNIALAGIAETKRLDAEGKTSGGWGRSFVNLTPKEVRAGVENVLFDLDEQKQAAKEALMDNIVKEAITTGTLSDQDKRDLAGLNVSVGMLNNDQKIVRYQAIIDILGKAAYADDPYVQAALAKIQQPASSIPKVTSKAEYDALDSGAIYIEDGKTYRKP